MAKRSHRGPAQPGQDNTGFIRAFISLLNFRERRAKLLTDGNHGKGCKSPRVKLDLLENPNNKHNNIVYDDSRSQRVRDKVSIKALMEEEMSHELVKENIERSQTKSTLSDHGNETQKGRNHKQRNIKCNETSDVDINNFAAPMTLGKSFLNNDLAMLLAQNYNYTNKSQEMHIYSNNMVSLSSALRSFCDKMHNHLDVPDSLHGQKQLTLKKALIDMADAISSQTSVEKQLNGHRRIPSQELVDALEVLNSNKNLLLQLITDPESLLWEHAQEFQDFQVGKHSILELDKFSANIQLLEEEEHGSSEGDGESNSKPLSKQSKYGPFWKGKKTEKVLTDTHSSQSLKRIIVLKPNSATKQDSSIMALTSSASQSQHKPRREEEGKRVVSFFPLTKIKRKLKRVFFENRKEQNAVSMDGVLHRIPNGRKDPFHMRKEIANEAILMSSPKRFSHSNEKVSDTLVNLMGKNKKINPKGCGFNINNNVSHMVAGCSIYEEAKRHLVEMLDAGVQTDSLHMERVSKSLGKILCLHEHTLSPISSPRRQAELSLLSPKESGFSASGRITIEDPADLFKHNLEGTSCSSSNPGITMMVEYEDTAMQKTSDTTKLMSAGSPEFVAGKDIIVDQTPKLLETIIPGLENKEHGTESNKEIIPLLGSPGDDSRSTIKSEMLPRVSMIEKSNLAESITEKSENNPVPVLESFFKEDQLQIQPQKVDFDDSGNSSEVLTVLNTAMNLRTSFDDNTARSRDDEVAFESSGSNVNKCVERCDLADQVLELSMIYEEGSPWHLLQNDRKLLLDCIDEVFVKIQKCFKCTSSMSLMKSSIQAPPTGKHLLQEVHKWIEGLEPNTSEEIVEKDVNDGYWMDLGIEAKDLAIKICNAILDHLMEESVVDLWC